jgi:hypothetical protein
VVLDYVDEDLLSLPDELRAADGPPAQEQHDDHERG